MLVHDTPTQVSQKSLQSSERANGRVAYDVNEKQHDGHASYEDTSQDTHRHAATIALGDLDILATPAFNDDALARKCMVPPPMPQSVVLRPSEVAALQQIHPLTRGRLIELAQLKETTRQQVLDLQSAYRAVRLGDPRNTAAIAEANRALQAGKDAFVAVVDEEARLSDAAEVLVDCAFMQKAQAQSNDASLFCVPETSEDVAQFLEDMRANMLAKTPTETAT